MRGTQPNGVQRPARADQRDGVADRDAQAGRRAARRWRCPPASSKPSSVSRSAGSSQTISSDLMPASVMPRTLPPSACAWVEAITWPSISGIAYLTPCTFAMRLGDVVVVGERRADLVDDDMAVEAEDLADQFFAKAVHDRHDDDQRRDAEHDAEEREPGDDRDEAFRCGARADSARPAAIRTARTAWCRSMRPRCFRPRYVSVAIVSVAPCRLTLSSI